MGCRICIDRTDISIHSLRMEGDICPDPSQLQHDHFNPLPPHGGRLTTADAAAALRFISIHSRRMEGDLFSGKSEREIDISIHSLRMEGDLRQHSHLIHLLSISIHSLRMEGDSGG